MSLPGLPSHPLGSPHRAAREEMDTYSLRQHRNSAKVHIPSALSRHGRGAPLRLRPAPWCVVGLSCFSFYLVRYRSARLADHRDRDTFKQCLHRVQPLLNHRQRNQSPSGPKSDAPRRRQTHSGRIRPLSDRCPSAPSAPVRPCDADFALPISALLYQSGSLRLPRPARVLASLRAAPSLSGTFSIERDFREPRLIDQVEPWSLRSIRDDTLHAVPVPHESAEPVPGRLILFAADPEYA